MRDSVYAGVFADLDANRRYFALLTMTACGAIHVEDGVAVQMWWCTYLLEHVHLPEVNITNRVVVCLFLTILGHSILTTACTCSKLCFMVRINPAALLDMPLQYRYRI